MENILTKALKEVLTPRYSEELRDAFDAGYTPTAEFEDKMRVLVRKTDRPPIFRYTRYLAAAAAVLIAIGAAVIVPAIMNSRIDVTPTNTSSTEPPVVTTSDTSASSGLSTTSGTSVSSAESSDMQSSSGDDDIPVTVDNDNNSDGDTTVTVDDTEDDKNPGSGGSGGDSNGGGSAEVSDDSGVKPDETEEDVDVTDDDDDDWGDDLTDSEDDVVVADDSDYDSEDDGDDAYDDDFDYDGDDDDVAYDDEGETVQVDVPVGTTFDEMLSANFGGITSDKLYARYIHNNYGIINYDFSTYDFDFVDSFIHSLGSAKALPEDTSIFGDDTNGDHEFFYFTIWSTRPSSMQAYERNVKFYDNSAWHRYSYFFNYVPVSDDDDDDIVYDDADDVDEEDMPDDNHISVNIEMFTLCTETGYFHINSITYYDKVEHKYKVYNINTTFAADLAEVNKFSEGLRAAKIPEGLSNVSSLADALGMSVQNIRQASADIHAVYDISVQNAKVDTSYLAGLFTKYASAKLTSYSDSDSYSIWNSVQFSVLMKNDRSFNMYVSPDGYIYINRDYREVKYRFKASADEFRKALESVVNTNGVKVPLYYETLGEYLDGKNFSGFTKANYSYIEGNKWIYVELTDKDELNEIYKLIESELSTAKYDPRAYELSNSRTSAGIGLWVKGYANPIYVYDGDLIAVRSTDANYFHLSSGTTDRIKKLLTESKHANIRSVDVEQDTDDEDDYEDDVDDDVDDDQNPIT